MYKLILLIAISCFVACNNTNNTSAGNADSANRTTSALPKDSLSKVATFSFVDGCMDNFRVALGEAKAYAFCKCMYNQLKAQNPGADSVAIEELAMDTARVNRLAAKCQ